MTAAVQETILQALTSPSTPRVFVHVSCGGWVLFNLQGGHCLTCHATRVEPGQYEKPGNTHGRT